MKKVILIIIAVILASTAGLVVLKPELAIRLLPTDKLKYEFWFAIHESDFNDLIEVLEKNEITEVIWHNIHEEVHISNGVQEVENKHDAYLASPELYGQLRPYLKGINFGSILARKVGGNWSFYIGGSNDYEMPTQMIYVYSSNLEVSPCGDDKILKDSYGYCNIPLSDNWALQYSWSY